jgi:hypothetical protein
MIMRSESTLSRRCDRNRRNELPNAAYVRELALATSIDRVHEPHAAWPNVNREEER